MNQINQNDQKKFRNITPKNYDSVNNKNQEQTHDQQQPRNLNTPCEKCEKLILYLKQENKDQSAVIQSKQQECLVAYAECQKLKEHMEFLKNYNQSDLDKKCVQIQQQHGTISDLKEICLKEKKEKDDLKSTIIVLKGKILEYEFAEKSKAQRSLQQLLKPDEQHQIIKNKNDGLNILDKSINNQIVSPLNVDQMPINATQKNHLKNNPNQPEILFQDLKKQFFRTHNQVCQADGKYLSNTDTHSLFNQKNCDNSISTTNRTLYQPQKTLVLRKIIGVPPQVAKIDVVPQQSPIDHLQLTKRNNQPSSQAK